MNSVPKINFSVWPEFLTLAGDGEEGTDCSLCTGLSILYSLEKLLVVQLSSSSGLLPLIPWRCLQRDGRGSRWWCWGHLCTVDPFYISMEIVWLFQTTKTISTILVSLSVVEGCLDRRKMTDPQALKGKGLSLHISNDRIMWEWGRYQRRGSATATAVFSLKNLQKPHKKNNRNIYFGREHSK